MSRVRRFIDTDVVTESRKRLHHVFDIFDSVVVNFSGGKDSLAVLHLARQVANERGIKKIRALFIDNELIPDVVIDFVEQYRREKWLELDWYCCKLRSFKFILGRTFDYVQWDSKRPHLRPMPKHAITCEQDFGDGKALNSWLADRYAGKVAFVTGIRAAESLMRLRGCVTKLNENYITSGKHPRMMFAKPIYDWQENDVFKFLHDERIAYCALYDAQMWSRRPLRVHEPLSAEAAKVLDKVKTTTPEFYDRLLQLFPEMEVQARYWRETDLEKVKSRYGETFEGIAAYIEEYITDPRQKALAYDKLEEHQSKHRNAPESYPLDLIFNFFLRGRFNSRMTPLGVEDIKRRRRMRAQ